MYKLFFTYLTTFALAILVAACGNQTTSIGINDCIDPYANNIGAPRGSGLNDTGIFVWGDDYSNYYASDLKAEVLESEWRSQDMDHGRDSQENLCKVGAGDAGFDYTKLDINGEPLPDNARNWACVVDNHTGLVWVNKAYNLYNELLSPSLAEIIPLLYGPNEEQNNGFRFSQLSGKAGELNSFNNHSGMAYCESANYPLKAGAGGKWDTPTVNQLLSLRILGNQPSLDWDYFPSFILSIEPADPHTYTTAEYENYNKDDHTICTKRLRDEAGLSDEDTNTKKTVDEAILEYKLTECMRYIERYIWSSEYCDNTKNVYWVMSTLNGTLHCRSKNDEAFNLFEQSESGFRMIYKFVAHRGIPE